MAHTQLSNNCPKPGSAVAQQNVLEHSQTFKHIFYTCGCNFEHCSLAFLILFSKYFPLDPLLMGTPERSQLSMFTRSHASVLNIMLHSFESGLNCAMQSMFYCKVCFTLKKFSIEFL